MKKIFKIFFRDFTNTYSTIGLREKGLFKKKNEFLTVLEAENYINENPKQFDITDELIILPVFTKQE